MLKICKKPCNQCLFSDNKIVGDKRKAEIIRDCLSKDTHFECHKGTIKGEQIVCRGWFDRYTSQMIRIAGRLNAIEFVKP